MNKESTEQKTEEGKQERNQTITFNVSDKTKQMFELLLLMTEKDADDVFERMVYKLAHKVSAKHACGCGKDGCHPHDHDGFGGEHHGHGYGHGHGMGHRMGHGHGMGFGKAFGRIPLWSRRRRQFSHQILKAFFRTEKDGVALRDEMYAFFSERNPEVTRVQFDGNLNNMGTEGGNSHGHVFDFQSGEVRLAEHIAQRVQEFREKFVKDDE